MTPSSRLTQYHLNSAERVKAAPYVRTELIHRRTNGPTPWWHTGVVAEIPGVVDEVGAKMLADVMPLIKDLGFHAVVFRPALIDFRESGHLLELIIDAAHDADLKALVRLAGADVIPGDPGERSYPFFGVEQSMANTIVRTRAALKAGADGIDLGKISESSRDPLAEKHAQNFTKLVLFLMAELAEFSMDHILAAGARTDLVANYHRHLEEEWLHHLRDDRLHKVPFDAAALREVITTTITERDRIGSPAAWKAMLPRLVETPDTQNVHKGSWEDGATTKRRASMRIILAGLPGAVYLPFGFSGGHVDFEGVAARLSNPVTDSERARVRHTKLALKLREKHDLGNGTFAWVSGLDWQRDGVAVFMSGGIMCVLNTSPHDINVPLKNRLLLRSDSTKDEAVPASQDVLKTGPAQIFSTAEREKQNCLTPGTTAWFAPPHLSAPDY
ncbi:MAG: hypothetical protein Q4D87_03400 [Actinomycetaceae bacterium]|nr:hypothetical protein [Actinomycetaceae bacterium]